MENVEIDYDKQLWIKAQNETLVTCEELFQSGGYEALSKFIVDLERIEFVAKSKKETAHRFAREKIRNKVLKDRQNDPNLKLDPNYVIKLEGPASKPKAKAAKLTRAQQKEVALSTVDPDKLTELMERIKARLAAQKGEGS